MTAKVDLLADRRIPTSAVRRAVLACVEEHTMVEDGRCRARLAFPPDFIGFQGHFPGDPILPGVCMLEAVLALVARAQGKSVRLSRLASAKFRAPVRPAEPIAIECTAAPAEGGLRVVAEVSRDGLRVADFVLHVTVSD